MAHTDHGLHRRRPCRLAGNASTLGDLDLLRAISLHITALELLPGLALYGLGIGFALAQLTNVVLSEIPPEGSGVASGANTTVRQVGSALTVQTVSHAAQHIKASSLAAALKAQAIAGVHAQGSGYAPPKRTGRAVATVVRDALEQGVLHGTRVAPLEPLDPDPVLLH